MNTQSGIDGIEDIYELTPIQQGLLFHGLYEPGSDMYLEQVLCAFRGDIDEARMREAFEAVVRRHPVLRTGFHWQGFKKPLQVVMKRVTLPWQTADWIAYPPGEQRQRMTAWLREDRSRPFALDQAPVLRCTLLRLSCRSYRLLWTFHHLLIDGWSLAVVLRDLFAIYQGLVTGQPTARPTSRPYREYVLWRQRHSDAGAADYWRRYLAGMAAPTRVTFGLVESAPRAAHGEATRQLAKTATARLVDLARSRRLTLNTVVSAAVAFVLARHAGESDVMFGTTVSGRPAELEHSEEMVGLFINVVPTRTRVDSGMDLWSWLQRLQDEQLERDRHSHESLVDIQGWSGVPRGTPLFETLLVFENYSVPTRWGSEHARVIDTRAFERTNYPLTLTVTPGHELHVRAAWYDGRCATGRMQRLLTHLMETLDVIASGTPRTVGALPAFASADRGLISAWSKSEAIVDTAGSVLDWISAGARSHPERLALACGLEHLSYRELELRANGLAHRLRAAGIGPESCVGVAFGVTASLVVAVLAVLKAGGAYVPIGDACSPEFIRRQVRNAGIRLVLCEHGDLGCLADTDVQRMALDSDDRAEAGPVRNARPLNLAYVIDTSCSRGEPKGCAVSRRALDNFVSWHRQSLKTDRSVRALILLPSRFDLAWKHLLTPLTMGGSVHLAAPPRFDGRTTCEQIMRDDISLVNCTPSVFYPLVEAAASENYRSLETLRHVVLGGEPVVRARLAAWLRSPACHARLMNSHGRPESADVSVSHWIDPRPDDTEASIPIGGPIRDTRLHVVDNDMLPVPIGTVGELCVGGAGLARGYAGRPGATAERFVADPFGEEPGARLFRTGDLVRYNEQGQLEYVGRQRDTRVTVRGQRVELGEVEAVIRSHPGVHDAAVNLEPDEGGNPRLIGYVVCTGGDVPDNEDLKRHAQRWLPGVAVPEAWERLARLPLTADGKLDRKQLSSPGIAASQGLAMGGKPRTTLERDVIEIWSQVLGLKELGIHQNFFDLGGHSLNATLVISRILQKFRAELPLRSLFDAPTVAQFAEVLALALAAGQSSEELPLVALPRRAASDVSGQTSERSRGSPVR